MVFGTPCITHNDFKWQMPEFEAIREGGDRDVFSKDDVENLAEKLMNGLSQRVNQDKMLEKFV